MESKFTRYNRYYLKIMVDDCFYAMINTKNAIDTNGKLNESIRFYHKLTTAKNLKIDSKRVITEYVPAY